MLDGKPGGGERSGGSDYQGGNASGSTYGNSQPQRARAVEAELDDEIPF